MSQRANYFKLGLFVIGAIAAGIIVLLIIGTGRILQKRVTVETYFNESVQGLDIGSKMKYRGVEVGQVTRISFTYVKYEQDRPMGDRKRYVLVEAQIQPRLVGGRAANDIASPESTALEVEKGLRVKLAPQGITGTSYLEIDYVDPANNPPLPIDWVPDNIYIPSAPSTVGQIVNSASEILERLHHLDVEGVINNMNKLLTTTNDRIAALDTKTLQQRTERTLAKIESTLNDIAAKKLSDEALVLLGELRKSNAELQATLTNPTFKKLPESADAAIQKVHDLVADPKLASSIAHMERTLSRLDRIFGGGESDLTTTIENLRQISDNLRDLTEDAKRYPSNVIFGAPPRPLERTQ
ncbi:MAG TPA: MlaD family protein [Casimicrobiaceae bacterium]|jgi:ABC-type transporter Mla subunit MlaD